MKRFFCSICRKVKRVRKYPNDVVSIHADDVYARVGTCSRHSLESAPVLITQKLSTLKATLQNKKRA